MLGEAQEVVCASINEAKTALCIWACLFIDLMEKETIWNLLAVRNVTDQPKPFVCLPCWEKHI